jgi:hypothetical protein
MENIERNPSEKDPIDQKIEEGKDDATAGFANAEKESAAEINRGGDEKSRRYMNKGGKDNQGPNWNKKSKAADGDTSSTAGVFK